MSLISYFKEEFGRTAEISRSEDSIAETKIFMISFMNNDSIFGEISNH
jgi:hypothetical protein